ncbi:polymeric immunoglobulin receptor-like, partial [Clarias magur]
MQVCFLLLLIQLHVTEGCRLQDTRSQNIAAYTGGSVLLPCSCTDLHTTPETLTWEKQPKDRDWVVISPESDQYKDRFKLVNDHSTGNLSLLISHLTVEDDGWYRCSVTDRQHRDVRLTVVGCTLNRQTVSVTGYEGQSVLLPCSCSHLQAKPQTHRWRFLKESHKEIFPEDQTNRYTDRVRLFNDHHPGNLSLLISHLTVEDGGYYRCELSNNDIKDISVTVKEATSTPKTKPTSKPGTKSTLRSSDNAILHTEPYVKGPHSTTIIITGVVGVLLLLLLILGGVMYWKHKGQRRGQTETSDGQTGQRTQQMEQNMSDVLYRAMNPKPECNKPEER